MKNLNLQEFKEINFNDETFDVIKLQDEVVYVRPINVATSFNNEIEQIIASRITSQYKIAKKGILGNLYDPDYNATFYYGDNVCFEAKAKTGYIITSNPSITIDNLVKDTTLTFETAIDLRRIHLNTNFKFEQTKIVDFTPVYRFYDEDGTAYRNGDYIQVGKTLYWEIEEVPGFTLDKSSGSIYIDHVETNEPVTVSILLTALKYTVTYFNYDGTIFYSYLEAYFNSNINNYYPYIGEIPTKPSSIDTDFTFSHWDAPEKVLGNTDIYPVYTESTRKYVAKFYNEYGTIDIDSLEIPAGTTWVAERSGQNGQINLYQDNTLFSSISFTIPKSNKQYYFVYKKVECKSAIDDSDVDTIYSDVNFNVLIDRELAMYSVTFVDVNKYGNWSKNTITVPYGTTCIQDGNSFIFTEPNGNIITVNHNFENLPGYTYSVNYTGIPEVIGANATINAEVGRVSNEYKLIINAKSKTITGPQELSDNYFVESHEEQVVFGESYSFTYSKPGYKDIVVSGIFDSAEDVELEKIFEPIKYTCTYNTVDNATITADYDWVYYNNKISLTLTPNIHYVYYNNYYNTRPFVHTTSNLKTDTTYTFSRTCSKINYNINLKEEYENGQINWTPASATFDDSVSYSIEPAYGYNTPEDYVGPVTLILNDDNFSFTDELQTATYLNTISATVKKAITRKINVYVHNAETYNTYSSEKTFVKTITNTFSYGEEYSITVSVNSFITKIVSGIIDSDTEIESDIELYPITVDLTATLTNCSIQYYSDSTYTDTINTAYAGSTIYIQITPNAHYYIGSISAYNDKPYKGSRNVPISGAIGTFFATTITYIVVGGDVTNGTIKWTDAKYNEMTTYVVTSNLGYVKPNIYTEDLALNNDSFTFVDSLKIATYKGLKTWICEAAVYTITLNCKYHTITGIDTYDSNTTDLPSQTISVAYGANYSKTISKAGYADVVVSGTYDKASDSSIDVILSPIAYKINRTTILNCAVDLFLDSNCTQKYLGNTRYYGYEIYHKVTPNVHYQYLKNDTIYLNSNPYTGRLITSTYQNDYSINIVASAIMYTLIGSVKNGTVTWKPSRATYETIKTTAPTWTINANTGYNTPSIATSTASVSEFDFNDNNATATYIGTAIENCTPKSIPVTYKAILPDGTENIKTVNVNYGVTVNSTDYYPSVWQPDSAVGTRYIASQTESKVADSVEGVTIVTTYVTMQHLITVSKNDLATCNTSLGSNWIDHGTNIIWTLANDTTNTQYSYSNTDMTVKTCSAIVDSPKSYSDLAVSVWYHLTASVTNGTVDKTDVWVLSGSRVTFNFTATAGSGNGPYYLASTSVYTTSKSTTYTKSVTASASTAGSNTSYTFTKYYKYTASGGSHFKCEDGSRQSTFYIKSGSGYSYWYYADGYYFFNADSSITYFNDYENSTSTIYSVGISSTSTGGEIARPSTEPYGPYYTLMVVTNDYCMPAAYPADKEEHKIYYYILDGHSADISLRTTTPKDGSKFSLSDTDPDVNNLTVNSGIMNQSRDGEELYKEAYIWWETRLILLDPYYNLIEDKTEYILDNTTCYPADYFPSYYDINSTTRLADIVNESYDVIDQPYKELLARYRQEIDRPYNVTYRILYKGEVITSVVKQFNYGDIIYNAASYFGIDGSDYYKSEDGTAYYEYATDPSGGTVEVTTDLTLDVEFTKARFEIPCKVYVRENGNNVLLGTDYFSVTDGDLFDPDEYIGSSYYINSYKRAGNGTYDKMKVTASKSVAGKDIAYIIFNDYTYKVNISITNSSYGTYTVKTSDNKTVTNGSYWPAGTVFKGTATAKASTTSWGSYDKDSLTAPSLTTTDQYTYPVTATITNPNDVTVELWRSSNNGTSYSRVTSSLAKNTAYTDSNIFSLAYNTTYHYKLQYTAKRTGVITEYSVTSYSDNITINTTSTTTMSCVFSSTSSNTSSSKTISSTAAITTPAAASTKFSVELYVDGVKQTSGWSVNMSIKREAAIDYANGYNDNLSVGTYYIIFGVSYSKTGYTITDNNDYPIDGYVQGASGTTIKLYLTTTRASYLFNLTSTNGYWKDWKDGSTKTSISCYVPYGSNISVTHSGGDYDVTVYDLNNNKLVDASFYENTSWDTIVFYDKNNNEIAEGTFNMPANSYSIRGAATRNYVIVTFNIKDYDGTTNVYGGITDTQYGTTYRSSFTRRYTKGVAISTSGYALYIDGQTYIASPDTSSAQYNYTFVSWGDMGSATIDSNRTVTVSFRRSIRYYNITLVANSSYHNVIHTGYKDSSGSIVDTSTGVYSYSLSIPYGQHYSIKSNLWRVQLVWDEAASTSGTVYLLECSGNLNYVSTYNFLITSASDAQFSVNGEQHTVTGDTTITISTTEVMQTGASHRNALMLQGATRNTASNYQAGCGKINTSTTLGALYFYFNPTYAFSTYQVAVFRADNSTGTTYGGVDTGLSLWYFNNRDSTPTGIGHNDDGSIFLPSRAAEGFYVTCKDSGVTHFLQLTHYNSTIRKTWYGNSPTTPSTKMLGSWYVVAGRQLYAHDILLSSTNTNCKFTSNKIRLITTSSTKFTNSSTYINYINRLLYNMCCRNTTTLSSAPTSASSYYSQGRFLPFVSGSAVSAVINGSTVSCSYSYCGLYCTASAGNSSYLYVRYGTSTPVNGSYGNTAQISRSSEISLLNDTVITVGNGSSSGVSVYLNTASTF